MPPHPALRLAEPDLRLLRRQVPLKMAVAEPLHRRGLLRIPAGQEPLHLFDHSGGQHPISPLLDPRIEFLPDSPQSDPDHLPSSVLEAMLLMKIREGLPFQFK